MRIREWVPVLKKLILAIGIAVTGYGCSNNPYSGKIIAVQNPPGEHQSLENAALIAIDPDAPGKEAELLSEEFAAAASPALSHDGRFLFFQGKKQAAGPWQIWVLDLHKKSYTRITDLPEHCTDPVPLPDETVIFSRERSAQGVTVNDLWRCGMDGCCLTRVTYNPTRNADASILAEGRILYLSSQQYPEAQDPVLMVMRPDGTKSELYSPGCCGWNPVSGGSEFEDGYIYFISSEGRLSRVLHNRPLHTFENLSEGIAGRFSSVAPMPGGECLVSYSPGTGDPFGIYRIAPEHRNSPELIHQGNGNVTDPIWITAMAERPRKLPSAVNQENPTGLLMSQNINHSILPVHSGLNGDSLANSIRFSYLGGSEAIISTEEDGSFYLKVDADMPFRIEALNEAGETVRGPSDWIYLRPNERRACTGCHADPELAPENIQPEAVKKDPLETYANKNVVSN
jgi:hypothetical protein